jgi:phospholipid-binding lipoprotein MlaA
LTLAGCSTTPEGADFNDPFEASNRQTHAFNRGVDRILLRPSSRAYGTVVPKPVQRSVGNLASNLDQPGYVLNDLLQGRVEDAGHNTFRFVINTLVGVGGLFDPATSFGLERRESDFGETLHAWGAQEGVYVELPLLGPSTARDAWGRLIDTAINPVRLATPDDADAAIASISVASIVGDRYARAGFLDPILYESADSYAQARLLYLQNRRFTLGGPPDEEDYFDPFEDPDFRQ